MSDSSPIYVQQVGKTQIPEGKTIQAVVSLLKSLNKVLIKQQKKNHTNNYNNNNNR
jgi:hypothetical protein